MHPESDTLVIRAGWLEGYLTEDFVSKFLADFESNALENQGPLLPAAEPVRPEPEVQVPVVVETTINVVDEGVAETLRKITKDFLRVNGAGILGNTSFISLGLDSIKAVGFAKRITKAGYKVTSTEVLKAGNIEKLAQVLIAKSSSASAVSQARADVQTKNDFDATVKDIRSKVNIETLKLSANDQPAVYPATSLQAGMLSQVCSAEVFVIETTCLL